MPFRAGFCPESLVRTHETGLFRATSFRLTGRTFLSELPLFEGVFERFLSRALRRRAGVRRASGLGSEMFSGLFLPRAILSLVFLEYRSYPKCYRAVGSWL